MKRTLAGKRNLNPAKNKLWDSFATPVQAPPIDSCPIFEECVMVEKTLVFTLLIANLTNVACLYAYL